MGFRVKEFIRSGRKAVAIELKMTVDKALEMADYWTQGTTFHEDSSGPNAVMVILAEEIRKLRKGEFICDKCGIRKDDEFEHGDF